MRLIDADALKEEVKTLFCPDGYKIMMLERIDNAPTVDCIEFNRAKELIKQAYQKGKNIRPQGEWKHIGGDEWTCSVCGHVITTEGSWENPLSTGAYHCENCGAYMKGGPK